MNGRIKHNKPLEQIGSAARPRQLNGGVIETNNRGAQESMVEAREGLA